MNARKPSDSLWWRFVYAVYPPILRLLERIRIHNARQPFFLGYLAPGKTKEQLEAHLRANDYEIGILAWRDPGEILGMRKLDREIYQYHLRLFDDGTLTGHYEYSSEGSPFGHVFEGLFEPRYEVFEALLGDFLVKREPAEPKVSLDLEPDKAESLEPVMSRREAELAEEGL